MIGYDLDRFVAVLSFKRNKTTVAEKIHQIVTYKHLIFNDEDCPWRNCLTHYAVTNSPAPTNGALIRNSTPSGG